MKKTVKVHPMWLREEESLMIALHMLVTANRPRGIAAMISVVEKITDLIKDRVKDGDEELSRLVKTAEGLVELAKSEGPFPKQNGFRWQLDSTNDWWAEIEDGDLVIGSRYGGDKFETLCAMVEAWMA